jgi:putative endonuclease
MYNPDIMDDRIIAWVYIVVCSDGTYYTGWTNDLARRVEAHNSGRGARYTRSRRPVKLVYHEGFATESEARRREAQIKKMTRTEKAVLVSSFSNNQKPL